MSEIMANIQRLEQEIADSHIVIGKRNAALRLSANKEFRELFMQDYFVTEAARLVQISSDTNLTKETREECLAMAIATGHTKRYLSMVVQSGAHAEANLQSNMELLDELRAEAASEDDERVSTEVEVSSYDDEETE